jgi:hypothetical protein
VTHDPELLRTLAGRIDAVPSVVRRSSGILGTAAAYLPGERLQGLRLLDERTLEVHVVMNWDSTVDNVEREVLEAIGDRWERGSVLLVIDDIESAPASPAPASRAD